MRIFSKLWKWVAAITIVGVVLALLAPFLTTKLLEQETIREKLIGLFAQKQRRIDLP